MSASHGRSSQGVKRLTADSGFELATVQQEPWFREARDNTLLSAARQ